jgi:long-chain acyl-CoA synthetase
MAWNTALDIFRERVQSSGWRPSLRWKERGAWRVKTWSEWDTTSRDVAGGLRALGVTGGDRVCILSNTRPEWFECDIAILFAGGVTVPIYQSNTAEECEYIISDCRAKVVVAEDAAQLAKLFAQRHKLTHVAKVVLLAGTSDDAWVVTYADLLAQGKVWQAANPGELDKASTLPSDVFTIVYTSGTTGPPKGVVLTHGNIVFECRAAQATFSVDDDDEQLLFLPLAHIFARILEWLAIAQGVTTAFAESLPKLTENMREVAPTFMGAVPRVYEKAYVKIQANLAEKRKKPVTRALVDWALSVGKKRSQALLAGRPLGFFESAQVRLADKLVFGKIQGTFGGRLRYFISGGAPLAREIAEFFHAAGLLVLEGYGLTETTSATHMNHPDRPRFGTVGEAILGVETKIADDGEVLVRGGNILREYYGKPEATAEVIDADGWFHTGDIGVVEGGYLRITDRKKDIIITAAGKNVAPQNIEGALKAQCPFVSQVMVHGDKRNYLTALVTLNEENLGPWLAEQGIGSANDGFASEPKVKALIQGAVDDLNKGLASFETIKKFAILPRDLTQEAGELTPTLKVKRKFCSEKYKDVLDALYV